MAYVPEDPEWDQRISYMKRTQKRCSKCGAYYRPIENVGQWKCSKRIWSTTQNQFVDIACDHGKAYTEEHDFPIPSVVAKHFRKMISRKAVLPEPVIQYEASTGQYKAFDAIIVRRFDYRAQIKANQYWPTVHDTGYQAIFPL